MCCDPYDMFGDCDTCDKEARRDDHDHISDDGWNDIKENWA